MTYKEYREKQQKAVNELPVKYAFSNEQFKEMMEGWGLTVNDTDKIYKLGDTGGFYLKTDSEKVVAFFKDDKIDELMQNEDFAFEAFVYEMNNHEYAINWEGDYDVCTCFGKARYSDEKDYTDYLKEMNMEKLIPVYAKAKKEHMKIAANWF